MAQLVIVGFLVAMFIQLVRSEADVRILVLQVYASIAILMFRVARHQQRFRFIATWPSQEIQVFLVQALGTALLTSAVLFSVIEPQTLDAEGLYWNAGAWGLIAASIMSAARHGSPSVTAHVVCSRRSKTRPVGRSESDPLEAVHSTLFSSHTKRIGCGNVGISRSVRDSQAAVEIVL